MRVIAGRLKGRRLKTPTWEGLRPSADRLRETLFNILAPRIEGARVLDAFAGTGAVGIEALSRGAAHVTFVEHDRRAARLIAENLAACGVDADYTIRVADVTTELRRLAPASVFDVVWLDPPYAYTGVLDVLDVAAGVLAAGGVLVLERPTRRDPPVPPSLERVRDVRSGDSTLTFFSGTRTEPGPHLAR